MSDLIIAAVSAEAVYPLRQSILRPEKAYDFSIYPADNIKSTLHLGAFLNGELTGIASIYLEAPPGGSVPGAWRLRDMGVVEGMRRKGYGSALLKACVDHISANQGSFFWCYARKAAVPFYLNRGFQLDERSFEMPGFGERFFMWRLLSHGQPGQSRLAE
ncbi:GNAT family N-acetyltransferase [bacterium]|nr:GNAT family N-acetyltransferase [bacterium]